MIKNRFKIIFIILSLIFLALVNIDAQGVGRGRRRSKTSKKPKPQKKPYLFGDPKKSTNGPPMLPIDYLVSRPQGSTVWLRMMSGNRIKGILMNVQSESGVITIQFPNPKKGEPSHGSFKASALEGVDY